MLRCLCYARLLYLAAALDSCYSLYPFYSRDSLTHATNPPYVPAALDAQRAEKRRRLQSGDPRLQSSAWLGLGLGLGALTLTLTPNPNPNPSPSPNPNPNP